MLDEFGNDPHMRDGRRAICRECHRAASRAYAREKRAARREVGLCIVSGCPEQAAPDRTRCAGHLAAKRAADRERRAARREAGLCARFGCPSLAVPGRGGLCGKHADARLERQAEYARARYAADPEKARERAREGMRARAARLAARSPAEVEADRQRLRPNGVKQCRTCGEELDLAEFYEDRARADGLRDSCRRCDAESKARRRSDARARLLARWAERDLYRCYITGADFEDEGDYVLHIDHQWPHALGGPDIEENLFPATRAANLSKGKRPFHEVIEEQYPGVLAAVSSWPRVVINLDTGEVSGDEDAAEFVAPLLGEEGAA